MAKKDVRQDALKKGLERLHDSGIDTDNVSAASIVSLTGHLGKDHDTDLAIAFLLGRVADSSAVAVLIELEQRAAASKDIKREARRSLFKLEQRGRSEERRVGKECRL